MYEDHRHDAPPGPWSNGIYYLLLLAAVLFFGLVIVINIGSYCGMYRYGWDGKAGELLSRGHGLALYSLAAIIYISLLILIIYKAVKRKRTATVLLGLLFLALMGVQWVIYYLLTDFKSDFLDR